MAVFAILPFALSTTIVDGLGSLASDLAVAPERDDGDVRPACTVRNLLVLGIDAPGKLPVFGFGGHGCPSCFWLNMG
jgi:hypothetical protein